MNIGIVIVETVDEQNDKIFSHLIEDLHIN